jgi:hypothetical protein
MVKMVFMIKVKVKLIEKFRDGGTSLYEDELNRKYFLWYPTKKVYNDFPFPLGSIGMNNIPPPYIREIPVELEIV